MDSFDWSQKKVLVTGGTGFLGKHLCDVLINKIKYLKILDFRTISDKFSYPKEKYEFLMVDIRDKQSLFDACRDVNVVFHCAAIPSIARAKRQTYYEINVLGTRNILQACLENNIKNCVYISSSTPYGIPKEFPLTEKSPLDPIGKYGRSKIEAENICWEFASKGLKVKIIRPRVIMGAGRIGIFGVLFERIIKNKSIYMLGNGNNVFQFTAVADMVDACIKAAEFEKSELFNIGSDDNKIVKEMLSDLVNHAHSSSKIIGIPASFARFILKCVSLFGISPLMDEQYSIADKNFKLDTTKAKEVLNWQPKQTNSACLIDAFNWYRDNKNNLPKQYRGLFGVLGRFKHSHQGGFQK